MKYLKKFANYAEYEAFLATSDSYNVCYIEEGSLVRYNLPPDYFTIPFHVTAIEDLTVSFAGADIEYSLDRNEWVTLANGTPTPVIEAGGKVYFRASGLTPSSSGVGTFTISGECKIAGNIMSLQNGDNYQSLSAVPESGFKNLFANCSTIIDAGNLILPSNDIGKYGYQMMFRYCTGLITAPELPALNVGVYAYGYMFDGCLNLIQAPSTLPAQVATNYVYAYMFRNCASLVDAPSIEVIDASAATNCCDRMFEGCSNLVNVQAKLFAPVLSDYCYRNMFMNCTSLVVAPELPALEFSVECYREIFSGCSRLQYIKMMAAGDIQYRSMNNWVKGVPAGGVFVKNAAAIWDYSGASGIPAGWTVQYAEA